MGGCSFCYGSKHIIYMGGVASISFTTYGWYERTGSGIFIMMRRRWRVYLSPSVCVTCAFVRHESQAGVFMKGATRLYWSFLGASPGQHHIWPAGRGSTGQNSTGQDKALLLDFTCTNDVVTRLVEGSRGTYKLIDNCLRFYFVSSIQWLNAFGMLWNFRKAVRL